MTLMFVPFVLVGVLVGIDIRERFSLFSFFNNIFLLQAFGINDGDTWNFPSWSISVEFYTYILFGLVIFIFSYKKLDAISLILSIIGVVFIARFSSMSDGYDFAFFRCLYSFFLGVLAFKTHNKIRVSTGIEFIFTIMIFSSLILFRINEFYSYFYPIIFFILIIVFSQESGLISNILKKKFFQRIGMLSFSIYLTHAWLVFMLKSSSIVLSTSIGYGFLTVNNGQSVIDFGIGELNNLVLFLIY